MVSALFAVGLSALGVFTLDLVLKHLGNDLEGPGGGVLMVVVAINLAVGGFIAVVSLLLALYHPTTWKTPVSAFAFCLALLCAFRFVSIQFAPFVLGVGLVVCLACCLFLNRNRLGKPDHVV